MMKKISLEKCLYYFDFDIEGNLYWKNPNAKCCKKGSIAGSFCKSSGYFQVAFEEKDYQLHRILYQLYHNIELNDEYIDHIDGNTKNNCKENLRIASRSENMSNRKVHKNNLSTKIKNITIKKSKNYEYFRIQIYKDKNIAYRECFRTDKFTLQQVIVIRDIGLERFHGKFMNKG